MTWLVDLSLLRVVFIRSRQAVYPLYFLFCYFLSFIFISFNLKLINGRIAERRINNQSLWTRYNLTGIYHPVKIIPTLCLSLYRNNKMASLLGISFIGFVLR